MVFAETLCRDPALLKQFYVYDDSIVRQMIQLDATEILRLFVEPAFQSYGIGARLLGQHRTRSA